MAEKQRLLLITLLFFMIMPFNSVMSEQHTEEIPTDSQMETEKKPKTPPDLVVLESHCKVFMGNKIKGDVCNYNAKCKVKNEGETDANKSTLRFKRDGKEYKNYPVQKTSGLKAGATTTTHSYKPKKAKLPVGNYKWTFTVDKVSGEVNTSNNTITFDCACPSKDKTCKKGKKK